MAIDEALLESVASGASTPVLRLYRWQPATLTLGYAQSIHKDIDRDVCLLNDIDVVRRSTGGRAVLHDREMTYAVVAPFLSGAFGATVLDCYRVIAETLQETLIRLGLSAELVAGESRGGRSNLSRAVCFSTPSQYELVVEGRKVAGSAQRRQGPAFLQHGSVPYDMDLDLLARLLKVGKDQARQMDKVGWLNHWLDEPVGVELIEQSLVESFQAKLHVELRPSELTAEEKGRADCLYETKFAHPDWTMMR